MTVYIPVCWNVARVSSSKVTIHIVQGDEAELAKKIATLKWHGKEMEVYIYHVFTCMRQQIVRAGTYKSI